MDPFVQGLDASDRRMLVLLPRGEDEVGVILTTAVVRMYRNGNILTFLVQEYRDEEMRLTGVCFDTDLREMFTGDGAPCFFAVDDTRQYHVNDMLAICRYRFPGARVATV